MADHQINNSPEVWKAVSGFPGYEVSDHGRIGTYWCRQIMHRGSDGTIRPMPLSLYLGTERKLLRPSISRGRPKVTLVKNGKRFYRLVYRLVLETFIGPCPPGHECRHLDGKPSNCFLINLAWGTHGENMLDRTKHGTNWDNRGMKCPAAKLTDTQVIEIRRLASQKVTQESISKLFNISRPNISHIIHRKRWRHIP